MQEVDFWSDINKAQEITQNAKSIKDKLDNFNNLDIRTEDVQILIEMSLEEEDSSSYKDIKSELKSIGEEIENLNIEKDRHPLQDVKFYQSLLKIKI